MAEWFGIDGDNPAPRDGTPIRVRVRLQYSGVEYEVAGAVKRDGEKWVSVDSGKLILPEVIQWCRITPPTEK